MRKGFTLLMGVILAFMVCLIVSASIAAPPLTGAQAHHDLYINASHQVETSTVISVDGGSPAPTNRSVTLIETIAMYVMIGLLALCVCALVSGFMPRWRLPRSGVAARVGIRRQIST